MEVTWPRMPWDHGNVVRWNHVHEVDGILGDGGSIYTLGVQGNRPFRAGSVRKAYPAVPEPPLKILPMSQMVSNYAHDNGWPERTAFYWGFWVLWLSWVLRGSVMDVLSSFG